MIVMEKKKKPQEVKFWIIRDSINGRLWTDEGWQLPEDVTSETPVRMYDTEDEADDAIIKEANTLGAEPALCEGEVIG